MLNDENLMEHRTAKVARLTETTNDSACLQHNRTPALTSLGNNTQVGGSRDTYNGPVDCSINKTVFVMDPTLSKSQVSRSKKTSQTFMDQNDLLSLWVDFKKKLKHKAMAICGEVDSFCGEKIKFANLQISSNPSTVNETNLTEHGHSRKDIVKFFEKEPKGNISYQQLFEKLKCLVEMIKNKGSTDEAVAEFKLHYSNLVVISGQPGIGKSTLTKRMVFEMLMPNFPLFKPEIVFFIQFRDVNYEREYNLLQFLAQLPDYNITEENQRLILEKIKENPNVFIIMDGLDEATIDPELKLKNCDIRSNNTAAVFILNLIAGNILPYSKKIITSRPYRIAQLPKAIQPKVLFVIQGLDDDGLKQICLDICSGDDDCCNKILDHLQSHADLKSYCFTPVVCILVMKSLYKYFSERAKHSLVATNVDTLTSIFVNVFKEWLNEKLDKFQPKNICCFAYKKFKANEFYFRDHELHEAKVNYQGITTFTTFLRTILKGKKEMFFVHLMWQEFLVALKLQLYTKKHEFEAFSVNKDGQQDCFLLTLSSERYAVVAKFLFGLCNNSTLSDLLDCIDLDEINKEADRLKIKEILQQYMITVLQADFNDEQAKLSNSYFHLVLSISGLAHEMGDKEFTKQIAVSLKNEIEVSGEILPSDIPNFNYILRARDSELFLRVVFPKFIGNSLQYFFAELDTSLTQNNKVQMKELFVEYIPLPLNPELFPFVLSHCIKKIEKLEMFRCDVKPDHVKQLLQKIKERTESKKICRLNLRGNWELYLELFDGYQQYINYILINEGNISTCTDISKLRHSMTNSAEVGRT